MNTQPTPTASGAQPDTAKTLFMHVPIGSTIHINGCLAIKTAPREFWFLTDTEGRDIDYSEPRNRRYSDSTMEAIDGHPVQVFGRGYKTLEELRAAALDFAARVENTEERILDKRPIPRHMADAARAIIAHEGGVGDTISLEEGLSELARLEARWEVWIATGFLPEWAHPKHTIPDFDGRNDERAQYVAADESGYEIEISAASDREAAEQYVEGGDWGNSLSTTWVNVTVWPKSDPDDTRRHKIAIEPEEPKCCGGEHDWQAPHSIVGGIKENPGVWGHGGGVTIKECCMLCGCKRVTDTWAQDRSDGTQGLRSVEYTPGHYADALEARAREWVRDHSDDDEHDDEELRTAFRGIFQREPDATDEMEGLWSHLCSAVSSR